MDAVREEDWTITPETKDGYKMNIGVQANKFPKFTD